MNAPLRCTPLGKALGLPRTSMTALLRRFLTSARWSLNSAFGLGTTVYLGFPTAPLPPAPPSLKSGYRRAMSIVNT